MNSLILGSEGFTHGEAVIRRAVFHQHDLGRLRLGEGGFYRLADERRRVVDRDDDADLLAFNSAIAKSVSTGASTPPG